VARIDAHLLADDARHQRVSRLCYCGHLLHATGDGITSSRTPLQIGAEIFGSDSISADVAVVSVMVATLPAAGLQHASLDLGHVRIFRCLVKHADLDREQENRLFDMLQRKSIPALQGYLKALPLSDRLSWQLCQLALLNGDISIIDKARKLYSNVGDEMLSALDYLHDVVQSL
ncbi:MAG: ATP phosphoribosyltransferase regulatory subunit, partial [Gammaproteobacteria bacterium]|nr:ATP phosphoribosyltransferase regulatory subunit [Gammaproteobacteria bacterium]